MTFRTKVFLIFLITVLASVSLVAYGVTFYTQRAFEQMDLQRTHALEVQFGKEFAQSGDTIVQQVENITNADVTVRMVLDLARPNADASLYLHDANGAAQSHDRGAHADRRQQNDLHHRRAAAGQEFPGFAGASGRHAGAAVQKP
jgi:hypothetical protein